VSDGRPVRPPLVLTMRSPLGGIFAAASILAASGWVVPAAVARDGAGYPVLDEAVDGELQERLEQSLRQLRLTQAVREKRLAVTLVDITDTGRPRLAQVNGNEMMYSASLPKIAILFGAFQKLQEGGLKRSAALQQDLEDMIRVSSNAAATRVLAQVGHDYLLEFRRYRLYDVARNGGLWVGKPYGPSPAYRRDPLYSISHGATALQTARFYYLLETNRLVSAEASREMKAILANPGIRHKFVAGLEQIQPQATIYRKSGTWRTYHSDSALVEHDGRRYIAVALVNDAQGGEWLRELIVAMDHAVFGRRYRASSG
jgi:beta-lactamase class A